MTENQGPQSSNPYSAQPYASAAGTALSGTQDGMPSKTDTVKDEAANVAGQAAGAARNVTETARAEAANVAAEVKASTRDLLHQAKSDLTGQAETQQQKAAEGIRSLSSQLRTMTDASEEQGIAADLIRQAADRSESVASWLENRDPGSVLDEVKTFARQRPGTFLLLAAGAGILAGRLGRSLQAGAPATPAGTTVPPQPAQPPLARTGRHQETVIAAGAGDRFFDEPTVPGTAGPAAARTLPAGTASDTTLRADNDLFPGAEGRPL